jgi:hypothetical protein
MNSSGPEIAILGAGPIGLEAALAALEHGYAFTLYEAAPEVGASLRGWGHVRLFTPWGLDVSPRMRRRLESAGRQLPAIDESCPTGAELADAVLAPLAELPEIAPHLRTATRVKRVGREGLLKHEEIGSAARRARPFRLLLENELGDEWIEHAQIVLDCTGTWGHPNALGDGGIEAPGEAAADGAIVRRIPDLVRDESRWAGKKILLVGAGHSAQTAAVDLDWLAGRFPGTEVIWALRSETPTWHIDPDDPLPQRARLTQSAKKIAEGDSHLRTICGVVVESVARAGGRLEVVLRHRAGERSPVVVDRVLSLTGFVGDHTLYRQLQVHECYATSGPMKLAAALLGSSSQDCLAQESHGADSLANPEPNFFILGSKSYGRNNTFLMRTGWQQVDEVFSLLAADAT